MNIYVAAAVGSSGAFEWRPTPQAARAALDTITAPGDDTCIRAVRVPERVPEDSITDWLSDRPELWEPAPGERHEQDAREQEHEQINETLGSFFRIP